MKGLWNGLRDYTSLVWRNWDRFWFTGTDPATLSLIRVLAGGLLLYTHVMWTFDLSAFFGPNGWLPLDFYNIERTPNAPNVATVYMWSVFQHIHSPVLLWIVHVIALLVFLMLFVGLFTRFVAPLAAFFTLSYAARVTPGAFFGLDVISCLLALYLMLGPCGARYSLDRLLRIRRSNVTDPPPSVAANLSIRLMQVHLCIVYLFSGIAKFHGTSWQDGSATWLSIANLEYQSIDVTFMAHYPWLLNLLTHVTVFWELFYCVLIWNRWLRPWMLLIAVGVHGFIALCLGMITFGSVMLIANLAFVSPGTVKRVVDPLARRITWALAGSGPAASEGAGQGTAAKKTA